VRDIARRLEAAGFPTFAVGGAVRDALLGLPAQDWDLATRARPQEVRRLFRRTVPIGIEHGTVGVPGRDGVLYEVTTFRRDVETFGRHATVEFADSIEDDLSRRDFTINALAWDPATGELRDPYGGLDDLAGGVLRTVGRAQERFAEDYLRVLRALRFAGHFRLRIDPDTWSALTRATAELPLLSAERVREELLKVLSKSRCASTAFSLYAASGVLKVLYPELERLVEMATEQGDAVSAGSPGGPAPPTAAPPAAPPDDAWALTLRAVDVIPPSRPLLRLAALLHAAGMPAARTRDLRGGWRYTGHEQAGARIAQELLRRLKASNAEIGRVGRLVRHQSDLFPPDARSPVVRRWMVAIGRDLLDDLWRLRFALARARDPASAALPPDLLERWRMARFVRRQHPPLSVGELDIDGGDLKELGLRPGPRFGEVLRELLERVLDDPELNSREKLLELARGIVNASGDVHLGGPPAAAVTSGAVPAPPVHGDATATDASAAADVHGRGHVRVSGADDGADPGLQPQPRPQTPPQPRPQTPPQPRPRRRGP
jgi:tRNA nucleotidyltransferase/poly(A) polymerase